MRRFVIVGRKAAASDDFRLDDIPGTSGRLDVLLRCLRAALLYSNGLRRNVVVYLVLLGGPRAPRVLRVDGAVTKFIRPDERSLALLAKKVLASRADAGAHEFVEVRAGISVASGGLERVIEDLGSATPYVLDEGAPDIRDVDVLAHDDAVFFVGDHLGLDDTARTQLTAIAARPVGVGPISIHADDVIAIVSNEIDRREARREAEGPFARGARLFDAGAFFDAHEAWEERWRVERDEPQRRFLQGLIQIAAAFHKLVDLGSADAASRLLGKGLAKLDACPAQVADMNMGTFRDEAHECSRALALGRFDRSAVPKTQVHRAPKGART
jgi:tRNA (pseudouridine54-N1)-methyltransferase